MMKKRTSLRPQLWLEELDGLDDWRRANGAPSRGDAIRELVKLALREFQRRQRIAPPVGTKPVTAEEKPSGGW
jgi:hypothetical protein